MVFPLTLMLCNEKLASTLMLMQGSPALLGCKEGKDL